VTGRSEPTPPGCTGGATPVASTTTPCRSATPLSTTVLETIAKCPAMKSDLETLQKDGWTVGWGAPGGGTSANRQTKKITVDPNLGATDADVVSGLTHEMGHAKYTLPTVSPAGLTREQYINQSVQANLEDEGEATLTQIGYKDCLKKGGGPDVPLSGAKSADYAAIAAKYPNAGDRSTARTEIANKFGEGEHPSNCPAQTYRQYYEKPCCAPACGTGSRGWAESLTDNQWKAQGGTL